MNDQEQGPVRLNGARRSQVERAAIGAVAAITLLVPIAVASGLLISPVKQDAVSVRNIHLTAQVLDTFGAPYFGETFIELRQGTHSTSHSAQVGGAGSLDLTLASVPFAWTRPVSVAVWRMSAGELPKSKDDAFTAAAAGEAAFSIESFTLNAAGQIELDLAAVAFAQPPLVATLTVDCAVTQDCAITVAPHPHDAWDHSRVFGFGYRLVLPTNTSQQLYSWSPANRWSLCGVGANGWEIAGSAFLRGANLHVDCTEALSVQVDVDSSLLPGVDLVLAFRSIDYVPVPASIASYDVLTRLGWVEARTKERGVGMAGLDATGTGELSGLSTGDWTLECWSAAGRVAGVPAHVVSVHVSGSNTVTVP